MLLDISIVLNISFFCNFELISDQDTIKKETEHTENDIWDLSIRKLSGTIIRAMLVSVVVHSHNDMKELLQNIYLISPVKAPEDFT